MARMHRGTAYAAVAVLAIGTVAVIGMAPSEAPPPEPTAERTPDDPPGDPLRAFDADSWWNTALPDDAPQNPAETEILDYLSTASENGGGCLQLAGAGESDWGQPIYWAEPGDPSYDVEGIDNLRPPELDELRVPAGAEAAENTDGSMTVFDVDKGYVVALTDAEYDEDDDEWSASGATVTYLDSNGLHVQTGRSDDSRNTGSHRGNNGAVMAARWDMVQAGVIPHVLKVAVGPEAANRSVFPMVGSDGDYEGTDPAVPPQGLRLRIKPSVDLDELNLHPEALVIAEALQRYGFYIGDSGGVTAVKLENTEAEGHGQLWDVTSTDLCSLPFSPDYWDVLAEGYDPSS